MSITMLLTQSMVLRALQKIERNILAITGFNRSAYAVILDPKTIPTNSRSASILWEGNLNRCAFDDLKEKCESARSLAHTIWRTHLSMLDAQHMGGYVIGNLVVVVDGLDPYSNRMLAGTIALACELEVAIEAGRV